MTRGRVRERPALFRALGRDDPPDEIVIAGRPYRRVDIFKHDSWAATARYRGPDGDVVCKFNRTQPIFGVPMTWLGRWLARRQARVFQRLTGVPGIPAGCGPVFVQGRRRDHAVAHAYIPGHPLGKGERVGPGFFPALSDLLEAVHRQSIAYVDLHKRENIVVSAGGRPYLVDFQVSFACWLPHQAANPVLRWVLRALQQADWYHFGKHVRRHRPEQQARLRPLGGAQRPSWINAHRMFAAPLRQLRRALLTVLGVRAKGGRAETEAFAEDALRGGWKAAA